MNIKKVVARSCSICCVCTNVDYILLMNYKKTGAKPIFAKTEAKTVGTEELYSLLSLVTIENKEKKRTCLRKYLQGSIL